MTRSPIRTQTYIIKDENACRFGSPFIAQWIIFKMDMMKFTSAMLDAIEHCAREAQIDQEWRSVSIADMRDAYDLLTRRLARDGADPELQGKGLMIVMGLDGEISDLQRLMAENVPEDLIAEQLGAIATMVGHLRK